MAVFQTQRQKCSHTTQSATLLETNAVGEDDHAIAAAENAVLPFAATGGKPHKKKGNFFQLFRFFKRKEPNTITPGNADHIEPNKSADLNAKEMDSTQQGQQE
jgi:hypothetical protein